MEDLTTPRALRGWFAQGGERRRLRKRIQSALPRYFARGGRIEVLPPQRTPRRAGVDVKGGKALDREAGASPCEKDSGGDPDEFGVGRYDPREWDALEQTWEQSRKRCG